MAEKNDNLTPVQNPVQPEADVQNTNTPGRKTGSRGKWFKKIPQDVLFSPGGIILLFFAGIMELIDLIPGLGIDTLTWELLLEVIFIVLLALIAKIPFQGMIMPFIIERIPGVSDILPTWLIRLLM
ncbi:MAG: hypothetical protein PHW72_00495 [Candidatus Pacebacteria bacterium]|nr:hypothetical protein [Candidatus Paceibacterota bacterium]